MLVPVISGISIKSSDSDYEIRIGTKLGVLGLICVKTPT